MPSFKRNHLSRGAESIFLIYKTSNKKQDENDYS